MPVQVSHKKRRRVFRVAIGGLDRATQAGCSQRGRTRRPVVPTAFHVEVKLSLNRFSLVKQLPGANEVKL